MQINKTTPIGFVGLGFMGSRIAERLMDAGFPLHVYDRTPEKAEPLVQKKATPAATLTDLAFHSQVIMSMLTNDEAVEDVYFAPSGIITSLESGKIVLDLSSVRPETSKKVYKAVKEKGGFMLDIPVSGSTPQAESGNLIIYAGGDKEVFEGAQSLFEAIAQKWFYLGESGSGTAMKIIVNDLLGIEMVALSEAITLGEKIGLSKDTLLSVLSQTAVMPAGLQAKLENIKNNNFPRAFSTSLMLKDMANVLQEAKAQGVSVPVSEAAEKTFETANAKTPNEDFSSVVKVVRES